MIPITFVDLETTGLTDSCEIIEIGAIRTNVDAKFIFIVDNCNIKVLPEYPVDPFKAAINGYNEEEWLNSAQTLSEGLGEVFRLMRGAWHAGSNPKFDEGFLKRAADKFHWEYPKLESYHLIDVPMLCFPLLMNGSIDKLQQETVAKYYEIDGGGHRAFSDAMQCLKIFASINNLKVKFGE